MLEKVLSFSNLYVFFLCHCAMFLICSSLNYLCTSWNIQSISMECLTCRNLVSLYVRWLLIKNVMDHNILLTYFISYSFQIIYKRCSIVYHMHFIILESQRTLSTFVYHLQLYSLHSEVTAILSKSRKIFHT